jgi:hypothetical protein
MIPIVSMVSFVPILQDLAIATIAMTKLKTNVCPHLAQIKRLGFALVCIVTLTIIPPPFSPRPSNPIVARNGAIFASNVAWKCVVGTAGPLVRKMDIV